MALPENVFLSEGELVKLMQASGPTKTVGCAFGTRTRLLPEESNRWAFEELIKIRQEANSEKVS